MKRHLFLREYWRAAVAGGAALAAVMLGARLGEAFVAPSSVQDYRDAVDGLALCFLPICGFIAGERAFASDLKERRILLLQLLPMSRSTLWAVLIGARLLAVLSAIAVALACRPSLPRWMASQPGTAAALLPIFLALFALGATVSLLWRSVLGVYLTGLAIVAAVVPPLVLAAAYLAASPRYLQLGTVIMVGADTGLVRWLGALTSLLVLTGVLLVASWRIFRSGELLFPRRRLVRGAAIAAVLVAVTLLLRWLLLWPAPAWAYDRQWDLDEVEVAPTGAHALVVERSAAHLRLSRVSRLTVASGDVGWTRELSGVIDVGWYPGGRTIGIVQRRGDRPRWISIGGGRTHVLRLGLDGEALGDAAFEAVHDVWWGDRRTLLVTETGGFTELRELGKAAPLAQAPATEDRLSFQDAGGRVAALTVRAGIPVSGWVIGDSEAQPLVGAPADANHQSVEVVAGGKVFDRFAAGRELAERLGVPVAGEPTVFLLPDGGTVFESAPLLDVDKAAAVYSVKVDCGNGKGDLYVRLRNSDAWDLVGSGVGVAMYCASQGNPGRDGIAAWPASGLSSAFYGQATYAPASGILGYGVRQGDRRTLFLFDPLLRRSVEIVSGATVSRPVGTTERAGRDYVMLDLGPELPPAALSGVASLAGAAGRQVTRWRYVPGSGRVEILWARLQRFGGHVVRWPLAGGGGLDWFPNTALVYMGPDGKERWTFPSKGSS